MVQASKIMIAILLIGCGLVEPTRSGASPQNPLDLLDQLRVEPVKEGVKYERKHFPHWRDLDKDCLDTRDEVLKRDSLIPTQGVCDVTSGRWRSPYDGRLVTSASTLEIDHLVPLKEAWVSGAWKWSRERRTAFANDLGYSGALIAVTQKSHRPKGDKDPSQWVPKLGRCAYVVQWIAVKWRWQLSIDKSEGMALRGIIEQGCLSERVSVNRAA